MNNYYLKKIYFAITFLVLYCTSSYSQPNYCPLFPRFDQEIFSTVNKTTDVVFGANNDYQGTNTILKMDIYQPATDTMSMRPLIIFAHGGSFIGGDKSNGDQADLCNAFAKRGYVCATINYRLGFALPINAATATDAVFRAVQDMKAAIRFFRKDAATTNTYKINPAIVFAGGTSAGAFMALHLAYLNTYAELPSTVDTAVIGNLDGNSGNPGYPWDVKAVINLCGALGDKHWVVPGDIPLVSMHGTADNTVPYSTAMLYLLNTFPIMVVDGSYAIHNYINTFNHPAEMYTYSGAPHVPFSGMSATNIAYMDTTVRFVSNFLYKYFGCTPSDPNPLQNTFTTTGTHELSADQDIRLSLNPVDNYIRLNQLNEGQYLFTVTNTAGQVVLSAAKRTTETAIEIPVTNLPDGIYFLHYKGVNKSGVLKVIVRHS